MREKCDKLNSLIEHTPGSSGGSTKAASFFLLECVDFSCRSLLEILKKKLGHAFYKACPKFSRPPKTLALKTRGSILKGPRFANRFEVVRPRLTSRSTRILNLYGKVVPRLQRRKYDSVVVLEQRCSSVHACNRALKLNGETA